MTQPVIPSKSVFFSSIQWASFVSIGWIWINLLLRPFDLSIGELNHDQVSAVATTLAFVFIMFQRLKPQSRLYFIKKKIDEIASAIEESTSMDNRDA